ncbi:YcxB family protein [Edaphobacter bradus]|uniref:YcxB family protein n=1 Tax=Edaphobacter bradus TaxID=2259016 RepID=UPI0021E035EA|nr:YcxB family protein [Edaphobacter bradus]
MFLAYMIVAVTWNFTRGKAKGSDALFGAGVCVVSLILLVGYRVFRLRRTYATAAFVKNPEGIAVAFDKEYFVSGLPGRSETRFLWPAIYDFAENERIALVYLSRRSFIVIPKHAMPEESWREFRSFIPQRRQE